MNKAFFKHYMSAEPTNAKEKYIFITDNEEISQSIILVGFKSVFLANEDSEYQYSIDTFLNYLDEIAYKGKCRTDYTYIPACGTKKANDTLEEYFKAEYLKTHQGWRLFKNKEYLSNYDKEDELKKTLEEYVKRFEGDNGKLDLMQFHHTNDNGKVTGVFDFAIFEHIKEHYNIFVCGNPYVYEDGVYIPDYQGTKLKKIIREYLYPEYRKSRIINQVYNLLVEADELQKDFSSLNNYPKSYINFRDCMLDAVTMEKFPHSPEYFSINQVPFKYEDVEKAPEGKEIIKFLNFAIPNTDDRKMVLEYGGYGMTPDTRQQRFLMICGQGGTGKSILIRLLEGMAGIKNVSNVSMQELNKRFSTSLLVGMTLNSCADLSGEALEDSSTMKKLIGEDWIMAEFKGKNGFMFKNYSKLLFSTNMLPVITAERTNGFYRRLLILEMDKQPEKPDMELAERLLPELPYLIKISVQALHEMYQRGTITISENSKAAVLQMRKDSDVVEAWISENCTVGADLRMERTEAFESFKKYCEDEERQSLTRNGFYKALRQKNFVPTTDSRGKRYFVGISSEKSAVETAVTDGFITVTDEQLAELPFT